ncbi:MAG TPA: IS110 family transposase [Allosphingosinicella sp.]
MAQEEVFVGIDISKVRLDVAVLPSGEAFEVANDEGGWRELVRRLRPLEAAAIGLEASGGYERGVLRALIEAGLAARLVNPARVRQFARACGTIAKNDRLDALAIARFVQLIPQRKTVRSRTLDALAELVTARRQVTDEITRLKSQAGHATQALLKRLAKARAARLERDRMAIDKAIEAAIAADPDLAAKHRLLRSVPGVGPVYAAALLALMPELGSLTSKQAAALLGVAPFDCDSGGYKGQRRIFGGRRTLRDIAYMAALVAGTHNPVFKAAKDNSSPPANPQRSHSSPSCER